MHQDVVRVCIQVHHVYLYIYMAIDLSFRCDLASAVVDFVAMQSINCAWWVQPIPTKKKVGSDAHTERTGSEFFCFV